MNSDNRHRLIDAVVSEGLPPDLRAQLLDRTLQLVRRRRRLQRGVRGLAALVVLLAVAAAGRHWKFSHIPLDQFSVTHTVVETRDSSPVQIVRTEPLTTLVRTAAFPEVSIVATVERVPYYQLLSDRELLALAAPFSPTLIRIGPAQQTLILAPDVAGPTSPH